MHKSRDEIARPQSAGPSRLRLMRMQSPTTPSYIPEARKLVHPAAQQPEIHRGILKTLLRLHQIGSGSNYP